MVIFSLIYVNPTHIQRMLLDVNCVDWLTPIESFVPTPFLIKLINNDAWCTYKMIAKWFGFQHASAQLHSFGIGGIRIKRKFYTWMNRGKTFTLQETYENTTDHAEYKQRTV